MDKPVRRWPLILLAGVGVIALAFAIGRFSTFGTSSASGPNQADAGFARDMQIHHAQAVEMAMELYRKTGDDELRVLSYDIATAQSGQRGEMYDWLVQWGLPQTTGAPLMQWMAESEEHGGHGTAEAPATADELAESMGMATDAELAALRAASGTTADCLFLELMIRHHEGAIPMAEAVVDLGSVPRVRTVAESMIAGQSAEIELMKAAQLRLGCGA